MTREEAIEIVKKNWPDSCYTSLREALETLIPELQESEDEKIRKTLINALKTLKSVGELKFVFPEPTREECITWLEKQEEQPQEELVYRMNSLMQEYIKEGKDDAEKEHRLKCYKLFWDALEDETFFEQKEQKPMVPSDEELQRHHDELYSFKVFAAKQAKEHHISFVHDFEWNNFCAEILSYFNKQKPAEWSEEDEKIRQSLLRDYDYAMQSSEAIWGEDFKKKHNWLKSLRPSWKPSEEQMEALLWCTAHLGGADHRVLAELYEHLKML